MNLDMTDHCSRPLTIAEVAEILRVRPGRIYGQNRRGSWRQENA